MKMPLREDFFRQKGGRDPNFHRFGGSILYFFNHHITITMKEGKVKFFNEAKGYGFIRDNESGEEYFVHATGLIDEIRDDDDVTFELREGRKGMNAFDVRRTD